MSPLRRLEDDHREPPAWEPEALHLPLELPPPPTERSEELPSDEPSSGVVVIDLA